MKNANSIHINKNNEILHKTDTVGQAVKTTNFEIIFQSQIRTERVTQTTIEIAPIQTLKKEIIEMINPETQAIYYKTV